ARALDDPPPLGELVLYQPHGDGAAAGGDGEHVVVGGDGGLTGDVLGEVEQGAGGGEQLVLAVAGGLPGQGADCHPVAVGGGQADLLGAELDAQAGERGQGVVPGGGDRGLGDRAVELLGLHPPHLRRDGRQGGVVLLRQGLQGELGAA